MIRSLRSFRSFRSFPILLLVSLLGLAAVASGQTAAPVIDLNTSTEHSEGSSNPHQLTAVRGGRIVFSAYTERSGDELWTSDGTASGSRMLFDACPGDCDSLPEVLGTLGGGDGVALAVASAEVPGRADRIWATDGSPAGTYVLTDNGADLAMVRQFDESQGLSYFSFDRAFLAGSMFFAACGDDHGCGVWASDGTAAGTRLVAPASSLDGSPAHFTATAHAVFFVAGPAGSPSLWTTDGSAAGTERLAELTGPPREITAARAKVFFLAPGTDGEELWASDGTQAGTLQVTQLAPPQPFNTGSADPEENRPVVVAFGSRVYFAANDGVHGWEIWRSNGTVAGTRRITDFADPAPFVLPALRRGMAEVKGRLIFPASAGRRGWALWTAGGTSTSASMLKDCLSGCGHGRQYGGVVTAIGGRAVFMLADTAHGTQLWSTDGTAGGTRDLHDFCAGPCALDLTYGFVPLLSRLAFALEGVKTNPDLWWTDGTPAGTRPLTHLTGGVLSGTAAPVAVGSRIFFSADSAAGEELWVIDKGKARQAANLAEDVGSSSPAGLTALGDRLVFQAQGSFAAEDLWQTRGTAATTSQIAEDVSLALPPPSDCPPTCFHLLAAVDSRIVFLSSDRQGFQLWRTGDSPATPDNTLQLTSVQPPGFMVPSLAVLAGRAFFFIGRPDRLELWRSDGTPDGTLQVASMPAAYIAFGLKAAGGALWFGVQTDDASSIWRSDGTTAGTAEVATLPEMVDISFFTPLTSVGSRVFFVTTNFNLGDHADQLWVSDGTAAGTAAVMGGAGVSILEMRELNGALLFFASEHDLQSGGLYRSDGTPAGTVRLHDFAFLDVEDPDRPHGLTLFAGRLFFGASEGSPEKALWSTDGTAAGTVLVRDIDPDSFAVAGDRLFLSAFDDEHGFELWQSDGTSAGTRLVQDIAPGNLSSTPDWLTVVGDRLYFTADDGVIGRELWSLELTSSSSEAPARLRRLAAPFFEGGSF